MMIIRVYRNNVLYKCGVIDHLNGTNTFYANNVQFVMTSEGEIPMYSSDSKDVSYDIYNNNVLIGSVNNGVFTAA